MLEISVVGHAKVGHEANFAVKIGKSCRLVPLKVKSSYTAELCGVQYACQSIPDKTSKIRIKVTSPFIVKSLSLENGEWPKSNNKSASNKLLPEIRDELSRFQEFEVVLVDEDDKTVTSLKTLLKSHEDRLGI